LDPAVAIPGELELELRLIIDVDIELTNYCIMR
jgi:hypothetical protein